MVEKRKNNSKKVYPVLAQRDSLTKNERKVLQAISDLSPRNAGVLYLAGNPMDRALPTLREISQKRILRHHRKVSAH